MHFLTRACLWSVKLASYVKINLQKTVANMPYSRVNL